MGKRRDQWLTMRAGESLLARLDDVRRRVPNEPLSRSAAARLLLARALELYDGDQAASSDRILGEKLEAVSRRA